MSSAWETIKSWSETIGKGLIDAEPTITAIIGTEAPQVIAAIKVAKVIGGFVQQFKASGTVPTDADWDTLNAQILEQNRQIQNQVY